MQQHLPPPLTEEEWNELEALKRETNTSLSSVVPSRLERFTQLLVRSMRERGG